MPCKFDINQHLLLTHRCVLLPFFLSCLILIFVTGNCLAFAQTEDQLPTLMICLFVRNKGHLLEDTLAMLEGQDYPKNRIGLYVRSDHNEDDTIHILENWLEAQDEYHFKNVVIDREIKRHTDQLHSPLEWSENRFQHLIDLKERALTEARKTWADWVWFLDADAFLTNNQTIRQMVSKTGLTVVAPMLSSVGLYANYWAGMTETFYYKRTDEYKLILDRKKTGCFPVPMVHSAFFVNLNRKESLHLTFYATEDDDADSNPIPHDDIIRFALSAQFHDVELNICNDLSYGYIMLPLDDNQSIEDDLANLSNLKIEMFAYGHNLPTMEDRTESLNQDSLGADQVYLINLDRRPDRFRNMQAIFDELKIKYKRISAVDGKLHVGPEYLKQNGIEMMSDFSEPYHGRAMTYGEIGCFMSHYNIWKDVIKNDFKEIIVFEDDVRFEPFFKHKLAEVRQELAYLDWDLVFLGRKILHNMEEDWVKGSQWLVHVNYTYWTLGYMLSHRGAEKLINEKPLGKMVPVDEYLPIMYDKHPNMTWKSHYSNRNLLAFSVHPLLLFPTHFTGEVGYVSDTEDTDTINIHHGHDEL